MLIKFARILRDPKFSLCDHQTEYLPPSIKGELNFYLNNTHLISEHSFTFNDMKNYKAHILKKDTLIFAAISDSSISDQVANRFLYDLHAELRNYL